MLFHTLYMSSAREPLGDAELNALLNTARHNNKEVGVTGMLLYSDGNFIQYLEGEEADVRTVYARIDRDPRHTGVMLVSNGPIEMRAFADWSMGLHSIDTERADPGGFRLTRESVEQHLSTNTPKLIITMMRRFYEGTNRYVDA